MKRTITSLLLSCILAVAGCSERVVTFDTAQCQTLPTAETRTRRVQTTCALRAGGGLHQMQKPCVMWNHRNATEHKQVVACSKDEWTE